MLSLGSWHDLHVPKRHESPNSEGIKVYITRAVEKSLSSLPAEWEKWLIDLKPFSLSTYGRTQAAIARHELTLNQNRPEPCVASTGQALRDNGGNYMKWQALSENKAHTSCKSTIRC